MTRKVNAIPNIVQPVAKYIYVKTRLRGFFISTVILESNPATKEK